LFSAEALVACLFSLFHCGSRGGIVERLHRLVCCICNLSLCAKAVAASPYMPAHPLAAFSFIRAIRNAFVELLLGLKPVLGVKTFRLTKLLPNLVGPVANLLRFPTLRLILCPCVLVSGDNASTLALV
jgi:hypothetical protein